LAALITATGPTVFFVPVGSVILQTPSQLGATYQWLKDSVAMYLSNGFRFTAVATAVFIAVTRNGNTVVSPVIMWFATCSAGTEDQPANKRGYALPVKGRSVCILLGGRAMVPKRYSHFR
jgi:hypothetical protein